MIISARNQIKGTIKSITEGAVNAAVVLLSENDDLITATISLDALKELGLAEGTKAVAVIKATEVLIGLGDLKLSARNQISGEIIEIKEGVVNAIVAVKTSGGTIITSTISLSAVKELGLSIGSEVKAVVKATSVMIAI